MGLGVRQARLEQQQYRNTGMTLLSPGVQPGNYSSILPKNYSSVEHKDC